MCHCSWILAPGICFLLENTPAVCPGRGRGTGTRALRCTPAPVPGWAGAGLSLPLLTYFLGSISSRTHVQLISLQELVLATRARVSSHLCRRVVPTSLLLVTLLCSANTVLAWLGSMGYNCSLPWSWNPPPAVMSPVPEASQFCRKGGGRRWACLSAGWSLTTCEFPVRFVCRKKAKTLPRSRACYAV